MKPAPSLQCAVSIVLAAVTSLVALPIPVAAQRLYVGLETAGLPNRSTDLSGFPNVTWTDHHVFEVSGAAATPDGDLYLCNGAFTTRLYRATLTTPPVLVSTLAIDASALAYGRGTLWGYSNYASPKGIYAFDPATGDATLVLDVYTGTGYRFFALDYNPVDDLLYGYTEYGASGLYAIDIDAGTMTHLVGTIPASNGQGRGLAVGNNTVYLTATRGDDQIPQFAYDLSQGPGGTWVGFTNPYPDHHATGGAAWIPGPQTGLGESGDVASSPGPYLALRQNVPNPFNPHTTIRFELPVASPVTLAIYSVDGRHVRTLLDHAPLPGGSHAVIWNGRAADGAAAAAGVYCYRLEAGGAQAGRTMVMVR
ncbi:MAG: FlgD immunoglobulin-like domain containing protein [Candidatus Eiseniibacteriota bacterium]|jgi:hypothetical protein